jgi:ABC-2 type transport system permease protein/oleandomycin transport system permease protein
VSTTAVAQRQAPSGSRLYWLISDIRAMTWRNLVKYVRVPTLLVFSTIQPIMFVLLFVYVFGGAIRIPGVSYKDYIMPGIFIQTVVFGSTQTGVALAEDLTRGMIDRFRSLPMARSAVLAGRTIADLVRNVLVVALMVAVGFAVGFHTHNGMGPFLGGMLLVLLFGYTMAWIFAAVGLIVGDPESAQAAAFPVLAPLVFASSAFVPVSSMPGWLQVFARNQPVSVTVSAVRTLVLGGPVAADVLKAVVWMVGIILVFAPLAVHRYRRAV